MSEQTKAFSKILSDKMKKRGMRNIDLARKIDVSDTTIYRYVKGDTKPKPLLLKRIADVFKCSPEDLYKD